MKKKLCALSVTLIFLFCASAFAGSKYNSTTGTKDYCLTIRNQSGSVADEKCIDIRVSDGAFTDQGSYFLLRAGVQSGGGASMVSGSTSVPLSYSFITKEIPVDVGQSGTLANGILGQILTITITGVDGSGTFILTPTTKSGFSSITFDAIQDTATLLYVDDTIGWILIAQNAIGVSM